MVSPACRKFLSKPQNTHNNSPAKIFFRQQHSAIYFPPKPFHLLSGQFPACCVAPRLCPTSPLLPHRNGAQAQLTQKVLGTLGGEHNDGFVPMLDLTLNPKETDMRCPTVHPKAQRFNVADHSGTVEE